MGYLGIKGRLILKLNPESCDHGNEPLGPAKTRNCSDLLSDKQFRQTNPTLWDCFSDERSFQSSTGECLVNITSVIK